MNRRPLDDAFLSPEETAFLESGDPEPKKMPRKSRPGQKKSPATQAPTDDPQPVKSPEIAAPAVPAPPQFAVADAALVSLNTRVLGTISTALLRASMDRKIHRASTFTQQDIVAEALTDWLKKHGYLK